MRLALFSVPVILRRVGDEESLRFRHSEERSDEESHARDSSLRVVTFRMTRGGAE